MVIVTTSHEDKRFDYWTSVLLGIHLDSELCTLMASDSVLKFDNFYLVGSEFVLVEIAGFGACWIFDIQAIIECFGEVIFKNNILKSFALFIKRSSRHFKAENRAKFIDGFFRGIAVIAVCLVHENNEV